MAVFGISSVEPSSSAMKSWLIRKMDLKEMYCEDRSGWNLLRTAFSGGLWY
jgi:hypothetical protein